MIGDPHLNVLTFLLSNEVPSYLVEDTREHHLLLSLPFGASYFILKTLPSDERVEFAIHSSMSLAIVQKFHSLGSSLPKNLCVMATRLDLLRYAFSQQCEWGNTIRVATTRGHVDCLHFAYWSGCPIDATLVQLAAEEDQVACLEYFRRKFRLPMAACVAAAKNGHLRCLQYLHEQGVQWDDNTTEWAAKECHLPCVMYAHQHGCPLTNMVVDLACERGDLACLHYAVKHGCVISEDACLIAAFHGHLSCLQYVHRIGGEWNGRECLVAAQRGHLSCLKFLHESDCPWDESIIGEALWEDQALCAMYALLQGCPCIDHVDILSIM